jgi:VCBS repeat-containing protein
MLKFKLIDRNKGVGMSIKNYLFVSWLTFVFLLYVAMNVHAAPDFPVTYYGTCYVDGTALTASDTGYTFTVEVDGELLVSYTMGTDGNFYVLKIPMVTINDNETFGAHPEDIARIFVNGIEVDESPQVLPAPNTVFPLFDLNVTTGAINDAPTATSAVIVTNEDTVSAGVTPDVTDPDASDSHSFAILTQPTSGSAAVVGNQLVYTPAADFNGSDSFTYSATDQGGLSVDGTASVTVTPVNDVPVADAGSGTTAEDTVLNGTLSGSDVDGDAITYSLSVDAAHGSVAITTAGSYTYTPAADYNGADSFSFVVNDGSVDSAAASISLTVTPVNDAPEISGTPATSVVQDNAYSFTPTASDVDGDTLTFAINVVLPDWLSFDAATGELSGTPANGDVGVAGIIISVSDGLLSASLPAFDLNVVDSNDAPTATSATIVTNEDTVSAGVTPDVTDPDVGDSHSFAILTQPTNGSAAVVGNQLVYTPAADFNGSDSFTYSATDQGGLSVDGTASVTVTPVNDVPVADAGSGTTAEDTVLNGTLSGSDVDGDAITYSLSVDAAHGSVAITTAGSYTYTPAADYNGADSFSFVVNDGSVDSAAASISLTVTPVNDAPEISGTPATSVVQDNAYSFTPTASDVDGDTLTFAINVVLPDWLSFDAATGELSGTPSNSDVGTISGIIISVSDAELSAALPAFDLTVVDSNDAPTATSATIVTNEDTVSVGVTPDVTDPDVGDSHSFAILTQPANGSAAVVANQLVYTPDANTNGPDSFTYSATDQGDLSVTGSAIVTVTPLNDAPVADSASASTAEDTVLNGTLSGSDIDGDAITYSRVTDAAHGSVNVNGDGSYSYTPAANYVGSDSFSFTVNDGQVDSAAATISLTVTPVNDAPIISGVPGTSVAQDTAYSFIPTAVDPENDLLTFSINVALPSWLSFDPATGELSGTPSNSDVGTISGIIISVSDAELSAALPAFDLTVVDSNDAPTATSATIVTNEDTVSVGVTPDVTDPDVGDSHSFAILTQPANGSAAVVANQLVYTPDANTNGPDSFTYSATDQGDLSVTGSASVSVTAVNDAPVADSGLDLNIAIGDHGNLDGSQSYDIEGSEITYYWAFTQTPDGSNVILGDHTAVYPSFIPDIAGLYIVALTVNDGDLDSPIDYIHVIAYETNVAPNANAGVDQNVFEAGEVILDGSASNDPDNGPEPLTYLWSFESVPNGSYITDDDLEGAGTIHTSFVAYVEGVYIVKLTVSDGQSESTDTVEIVASAQNIPPIAVAGDDQLLTIGETVYLDGSLSSDPDSGPEYPVYTWRFVSLPDASELTNDDIVGLYSTVALFTPDVAGTYVLQLSINDGIDINSDNVVIEIQSGVDVPGDLNEDGFVDVLDYNLFIGTFGRCIGDPEFIEEADYDGDGCISFVDYQIWYGYYFDAQ